MGAISSQGTKNFILIAGGAGLGFLVSALLLPRFLSPEQNGILRLIATWSLMMGQLFSLGMMSGLIKLHPRLIQPGKPLSGGLGKRYYGLPVLVWALAWIPALLWSAEQMARPLLHGQSHFGPFAWLLVPTSLGATLFILSDTLARIHRQSILGAFSREVLQRLLFGAGICAVWAGWMSETTYIYWYAISLCVPAIVLVQFLWQKKYLGFGGSWKQSQEKSVRAEFSMLSLFGILAGLTTHLLLFVDTVMVEKMLGTGSTGIYAVMGYFGTLIVLPGRALDRIATPIVASLLANNQVENVKGIYRNSCFVQFLLGSFLAGLLWLNGPFLLEFMRPEFAEGLVVMQVLVLANLIDGATGMNGGIIATSSHYRYNTYFMAFLLVVSVGANLWLIPKMGIIGAAWATCLTTFLYNILKFVFLWHKMKLQPYDLGFLRAVALAGLAIGLGWWFSEWRGQDGLYGFFERSFVLMIAFTGLLISPSVRQRLLSVASLLGIGKS